MSYFDQKHSSRQLSSIVGVAIVHTAIGYAFISGLAMEVWTNVPTILRVISIPDDTPPPPLPKTPPPEAQAERVNIPNRVVKATGESNPNSLATVPPTLPTTDEPKIDLTPLPPLPRLASGPRVKGNRAQWITTEDYPSSSVRNNEEGSVSISVRVGADGRIASCEVTASSGHPALDAVTCRLYTRRARFDPAKDSNGIATAAIYSDRVRWQLPRE